MKKFCPYRPHIGYNSVTSFLAPMKKSGNKAKTFLKPDDENLRQIMLQMTPERKERITRAAANACKAVEAETADPAEKVAALQVALDAMNDRHFNKHYFGTVLVGRRDVPESNCYGCGKPINAVNDSGGNEPEAGDVSICSHCGAILVFDRQMHAVRPPDKMMDALLADPKIVGIVAAVKGAITQNKQAQP